jgi:single-stranded-DNA-specific exonuclease
LPLDQITSELYAAVQRLHPTGMDNEDPIFIATRVGVAAEPVRLKERHIKLRLRVGNGESTIPALGWHWADRSASLGIQQNSVLDIAYRLRRNDHPEYGGIELEIEDLRLL